MQDPVLVDVATLQPGSCFCCGTVEGPLVDTMVETFDGRVYICVATCLTRFGQLVDFGDTAELQQRLDDAQTATTALVEQLERQQPYVDAIARAAADFVSEQPEAEREPEPEPPVAPAAAGGFVL